MLGYGGMAAVFLAEDPRLGRRVAVKVMAPGLMVDSRLVERFEQEARTIAQLSHPNIVTIYEVEQREGLHYFSMSYMPGRSLGDVLGDLVEPLAIDVVRAWLAQVGGALAYAHRAGIVHRDIKPGNILLDGDGNARVTDFGIAKVADEPSLTRTGMLVGTPAYMSPEQCTTGQVEGASDQYSLGAVAYQMLTGAPPFSGNTIAVLQAHVAQPPRPIRDVRPDCPEELASAVERMLAKEPAARWPGLSAAIGAMGATLPGLGDPVLERMAAYATHVAGIAIEDPPTELREGEARPLRAIVWDAAGNPLESRRIFWESSEPAVAVVTETSALCALRPGSSRIAARCGNRYDVFDVAVAADPVESLEVVPPAGEVPRGHSIELSARARPRGGGRPRERAVVWTSSNPSIARVSLDGRVEAVGAGTAVITASSGEISAAVSLTVTEPEIERSTLTYAAPAAPAPATPAAATPAQAMPATPAPDTAAAAVSTAAAPGAGRPQDQHSSRTERYGEPADAGRPVGGRLRRALPLAAAVVVVVGAGVVVLSRRGGAPAEPPQAAATAPATPPADGAADGGGDRVADAGAANAASGAGDAGAGAGDAGAAASRLAATSPRQATDGGRSPVTGTTPQPATGSATRGAANAADAGGAAAPTSSSPRVSSPAPAGGDGTRTGAAPAGGDGPTRTTPGVPPPQPASPGDASGTGGAPAAGAAAATAPATRVRGDAADAASIGRAIGGFVAAFSARRVADVIPLMPSDARAPWRQLLQSPQVTQFRVTLKSSERPRFTADGATAAFVVRVSFHNENRTVDNELRYVGSLEPTPSGEWRLTGLQMGGR